MQAAFYILFSQSANQYYIGHTTEPLDERLRKHNSNHRGYTGKFRDWQVVYSQLFPDKKLAYAREREVKAWKNRNKILALISPSSEHPA